MKEYSTSIDEMVNELAPTRQAEVRDFVEFLLAKQRSRSRRLPRFDWAGGLQEMRENYTSVELQHEVSRWRSETK